MTVTGNAGKIRSKPSERAGLLFRRCLFAVQWLYNALYLKDAFAIDLSRQEALYLTIHIHWVLEEHRTV